MANYQAVYQESERQLRHFLAPLMEYFDSPTVNEIMINRHDKIFVEEAGAIRPINASIPDSDVEGAVNAIMNMNRKTPEPLMDARLVGMRVAAVLPPVAVHGPVLSVRKLSMRAQTLDDFLRRGDFERIEPGAADVDVDDGQASYEAGAQAGGQGLADFLKWAMTQRKDIALVGGTSSGKTTIGGALLACIPDDHRIITLEDTNELVLAQPNVVQLEANPTLDVTLRRLIKMCLRLRPDRIIVGETRGAELFDLLDAMNTGHPGALFTLHGNSAIQGLLRMETLLRMSEEMREAKTVELRRLIASSLDYVVFQRRRGAGRGPDSVIRLEKTLDSNDNYQIHQIYSRLI